MCIRDRNRVDLSSISEVRSYITEWPRFFGPPCTLCSEKVVHLAPSINLSILSGFSELSLENLRWKYLQRFPPHPKCVTRYASNSFITNFLESLPVKKNWKICREFTELSIKLGVLFFEGHSVYICVCVCVCVMWCCFFLTYCLTADKCCHLCGCITNSVLCAHWICLEVNFFPPTLYSFSFRVPTPPGKSWKNILGNHAFFHRLKWKTCCNGIAPSFCFLLLT